MTARVLEAGTPSAASPGDVVTTPPAWRVVCPWLPTILREGRVYVGPDGEPVLRVSDGMIDFVHQGALPGLRSIASDPAARGRRP